MTLALLASAQLLADDVDAWGMPRLRALLPIAGMTLIEQQAERARSCGVTSMMVLVDAIPPALAEACDRIRARGLPVQLVRDGSDVAAGAGAADRLMLAADGLVAGELPWKAAAAAKSAMLVAQDGHATQTMERIDADTRWAGLAMLPQSALAALADAPADWDPQLLLFRRAVQEDAPRIAWDDGAFVSGDIILASSAVAATAAEARLMGAAEQRETGMARRYLIGPLVRLFAGPLLGAQRSSVVARGATIFAAVVAGGAAVMGQPLVAVGLGLIAAIAHAVGDFVAGFRPEGAGLRRAMIAGFVLQILAFALVERGVQAGTAADWIGSGSMAATIMLLTGIVPNKHSYEWPLLDLPAAWMLMAVMLPLAGREEAATFVGMSGLLLFGLANWHGTVRDEAAAR
jgi:hypothetical protein